MHDWQFRADGEIRRLVQTYNALGDAGRFDELLDLFVDDARFTIGGDRTYEGRHDIANIFTGTAEALAEWGHDRPFFMRHFTSTHLVEFDSPTRARGTCHYQVLMAHGLDHWGRYRDEYIVVNDEWLFAARRERRDGVTPTGWAASRG